MQWRLVLPPIAFVLLFSVVYFSDMRVSLYSGHDITLNTLFNRAPHLPEERSQAKNTVWDLGFNDGTDSLHYLSLPQQYSVLAVEANPSLVQAGARDPRLSPHIASGRLRLLHVAIRPREAPAGNLTFYINNHSSEWSSVYKEIGCRVNATRNEDPNPPGSVCRPVLVPTRTCAELYREYGLADVFFLKIDVEGLDWDCLRDLEYTPLSERPTYVSVEEHKRGPPAWWKGVGATARVDDGLHGPAAAEFVQALLMSLGYNQLKRVAQHLSGIAASSGELPEDSVDVANGRTWSGFRSRSIFADLHPGRWFDWHGKLASSSNSSSFSSNEP